MHFIRGGTDADSSYVSGNCLPGCTLERPKGAVCAQAYSFFDKNVNLGADFTSGEVYTMNVNEKTTSFVMQ